MTKDIESEIQDWIAKESEQSYRFASDALVIGADELAEFVTEVFKKLEGCVVVPEHNIQLNHGEESFQFDLIDLLRRSLKSSKVLKTRENWSHVSKMLGVGSTVAMLICKEMQVEPNSTQMIVEAARGGNE